MKYHRQLPKCPELLDGINAKKMCKDPYMKYLRPRIQSGAGWDYRRTFPQLYTVTDMDGVCMKKQATPEYVQQSLFDNYVHQLGMNCSSEKVYNLLDINLTITTHISSSAVNS